MDSGFVEVDIKPDISMLEPTAEVTISEGFKPINNEISKIEDPLSQMHKTTKVKRDFCSETYEMKNETAEIMQREHLCEICNETFINSDILKKHIRNVHYKAKCRFCNKNFSTQGNLKFHIKSVHEGLKNHKCETCGKGFTRQHYLRHHIVSVHKEDGNKQIVQMDIKKQNYLQKKNFHFYLIESGNLSGN